MEGGICNESTIVSSQRCRKRDCSWRRQICSGLATKAVQAKSCSVYRILQDSADNVAEAALPAACDAASTAAG